MNRTLPTPPKTSNRQQARDLSARLDSVEQKVSELNEMLPQFMFATDRSVSTIQNQTSHWAEIQNALVAIIGEETVIKKIEELRLAQAVKEAEQRRARVVQALEQGKIEAEETVRGVVRNEKGEVTDEGSIIALVEFDTEGKEIPYSYACVPVAKISKPETQAALAGQKPGFEWELEFKDEEGKATGKGKAVLLGVYKRKALPPPPAVAPVAPEAAAAPAQTLPDVNTEAGDTAAVTTPAPAQA